MATSVAILPTTAALPLVIDTCRAAGR
jgi:hypothetical protein